MSGISVSFTDISDWQKNIHFNTGGTRSKYIALHPDTHDEYFFKGSKEVDGEIRYPTEFWSEIVSSKIGSFFGFPMLDYNIAYDVNHNQKIGCISKSMVLHSKNKLTEGITYLTGANSNYKPEEDKKDYTFQFICDSLREFSLEAYIVNIIEIIIFDCLIGNSDRHQENWGVIMYYKTAIDILDKELLRKDLGFWGKLAIKGQRLFNKLSIDNYEAGRGMAKSTLKFHSSITPHKFAKIYDSGCCLGREHLDSKVEMMLKDNQMIEAYVRKGVSEIHWQGFPKKKTHFELVELIMAEYSTETKRIIKRIKEKHDPDKIKKLIYAIDINLPDNINFKLSDTRKELMFKLVTLRVQKLIGIYESNR